MAESVRTTSMRFRCEEKANEYGAAGISFYMGPGGCPGDQAADAEDLVGVGSIYLSLERQAGADRFEPGTDYCVTFTPIVEGRDNS
jgi:hypothetical protein